MRHALVLLIFLYSVSAKHLFLASSHREVLKPYAIASFSMHMVKHMLKSFTVWESAHTGIFLTYFSLPRSSFPLIHLKTHLLYRTIMLSEQWSCIVRNKFPAFYADEKETWEKPISYIHSSLTFCQKSNVQFSSKKQGIY